MSSQTRQKQRHRERQSGSLDEQLSRTLSWALRHNAPSIGLSMGTDGYVSVKEMLSCHHPRFCINNGNGDWEPRYTLQDVQRVVSSNSKQRYKMEKRRLGPAASGWIPVPPNEEGNWFVRANQGHSIPFVNDEEILHRFTEEELRCMPLLVHGTTRKAWEDFIRPDGALNRMRRKHIHFATWLPDSNQQGSQTQELSKQEKPKTRTVSGMRTKSEIHVYADVHKCAKDGVPFYLSDNDVALTPGLRSPDGKGDGTLPLKYIEKVVDAKTHEVLYQNCRNEEEEANVSGAMDTDQAVKNEMKDQHRRVEDQEGNETKRLKSG